MIKNTQWYKILCLRIHLNNLKRKRENMFNYLSCKFPKEFDAMGDNIIIGSISFDKIDKEIETKERLLKMMIESKYKMNNKIHN